MRVHWPTFNVCSWVQFCATFNSPESEMLQLFKHSVCNLVIPCATWPSAASLTFSQKLTSKCRSSGKTASAKNRKLNSVTLLHERRFNLCKWRKSATYLRTNSLKPEQKLRFSFSSWGNPAATYFNASSLSFWQSCRPSDFNFVNPLFIVGSLSCSISILCSPCSSSSPGSVVTCRQSSAIPESLKLRQLRKFKCWRLSRPRSIELNALSVKLEQPPKSKETSWGRNWQRQRTARSVSCLHMLKLSSCNSFKLQRSAEHRRSSVKL